MGHKGGRGRGEKKKPLGEEEKKHGQRKRGGVKSRKRDNRRKMRGKCMKLKSKRDAEEEWHA